MTHSFKPVTTEQSIQVAILDELQQIRGLLEPSKEPAAAELPPEPEKPADAPAAKPRTAKKAAANKTTRKTVTGR